MMNGPVRIRISIQRPRVPVPFRPTPTATRFANLPSTRRSPLLAHLMTVLNIVCWPLIIVGPAVLMLLSPDLLRSWGIDSQRVYLWPAMIGGGGCLLVGVYLYVYDRITHKYGDDADLVIAMAGAVAFVLWPVSLSAAASVALYCLLFSPLLDRLDRSRGESENW